MISRFKSAARSDRGSKIVCYCYDDRDVPCLQLLLRVHPSESKLLGQPCMHRGVQHGVVSGSHAAPQSAGSLLH